VSHCVLGEVPPPVHSSVMSMDMVHENMLHCWVFKDASLTRRICPVLLERYLAKSVLLGGSWLFAEFLPEFWGACRKKLLDLGTEGCGVGGVTQWVVVVGNRVLQGGGLKSTTLCFSCNWVGGKAGAVSWLVLHIIVVGSHGCLEWELHWRLVG